MDQSRTTVVEASTAQGFLVKAGSTIRIVNTMGSQVVGTWAFASSDISQFMSMEHTRIHSASSRPKIGTVFHTNRHQPILELTADKSPGVHDWFLAACNQRRYELLGHGASHASCEDNLISVMRELGHNVSSVPCPLNLFENVSVLFGNPMEIKQPVAMPGDYVWLKTLMDCLIVLSSCPQDILPTNGPDRTPQSFEVEIVDPPG